LTPKSFYKNQITTGELGLSGLPSSLVCFKLNWNKLMNDYIKKLWQRVWRMTRIVFYLGILVGYTSLFIAWLLFLGGIIPYLVFFHGK
jgi:hypothetical protein